MRDPGRKNSLSWNPPPAALPANTNYYTYVGQELQSSAQNLNYSLMELKAPGTNPASPTIRAFPPKPFSITTLPLQYTYSCSASGNVNSCKFREIFEYGVDTDVNPVDRVEAHLRMDTLALLRQLHRGEQRSRPGVGAE